MKPRFIAGAVCPSCGAMDRLVSDGRQRRCVSCGFADEQPTGTPSAPRNRLDRRTVAPTQPVRILPSNEDDDG